MGFLIAGLLFLVLLVLIIKDIKDIKEFKSNKGASSVSTPSLSKSNTHDSSVCTPLSPVWISSDNDSFNDCGSDGGACGAE
ncbi:hypothetical protein JDS99_27090 [Bacillus cereus group sp. N6]|uniref:hypothetical protein n=1 Tax=Bacillus cereus group sp. N6 TaxID=2794583 RepID=UPI0018F30229|nr:hypothetical protein [Bacillus cereus group sp. N6]MBJ8113243.1 hypothetical protein [Bacillus cereus group sp. N6]